MGLSQYARIQHVDARAVGLFAPAALALVVVTVNVVLLS